MEGEGIAASVSAEEPKVSPPQRARSFARPAIYFLLAAIVFYFAGSSMVEHMSRIDWKVMRFRGWPMTAALACLMGMRLLNSAACRMLLLSLGHRVGLRWTTGAIWVSSLGRYVPGKMLAGLSAAVLMTRRGVELSAALAVMFLYTALMVVIGVMIAAPLMMTPALRRAAPGLWAASLAVIVAGGVALHPRVFAWVCNAVLKRLGQWQLLPRPTTGPYVTAIFLLLVRAALLGASGWFVARSFTTVPVPISAYPMMLSAISLALVAGFLAVFVPAGLGVQEGVFLIVFGPMLGAEAGLLALVFRALQVAADLLAGVAGLAILHPRFSGRQRAERITTGVPRPRPEEREQPVPGLQPGDGLPIAPIPRLLMEMPHKPDFFIVGAAKCGTTSLYEYLRRHPQIHMSPHKEPHYFARDFYVPPEWCIRDDEQYVQLFAGAEGATRVGEASVWYIYSQAAAQELKAFSPDARIIVMLRDPIDMMYSLHGQFLWNCNDDILNFEEALAAQEERSRGLRIPAEAHMAASLQYARVASFSSQVRRYYDAFGADRVHVILFQDFLRDTPGEYAKVLRFLDVDPTFVPDFKIANSAKPITPRLNRFFARRPVLRRTLRAVVAGELIRRVNYAIPYVAQAVARPSKIDPALRARLLPQFIGEIEALEQLIGRDLSAWKR